MGRTARRQGAFTLIELLVVIAIIAILAAILIPVLARARVNAMKLRAGKEVLDIYTGILSYESTYSRLPGSSDAITSALQADGDFTYGTFGTASIKTPGGGTATVESPGTYQANNAEIMSVLLDLETLANGQPTANRGHVKNPQRLTFLNARFVSDTTSPGIGQDGVYRDPWGNPYIITLDLNSDEKARDAFYRTQSVSEDSSSGINPPPGLNGLIRRPGTPVYFEGNVQVMVWSAGPDKTIDPGTKATMGVNKDNILSWK